MTERDYIDSHRAVSPLRPADDAVILDNSNLTIAEQKQWLLDNSNLTIAEQKQWLLDLVEKNTK